MTVKTLMAEALRLPPGKRAQLAAELLSSLEGEDAREIEQLWIEEAERRYAAYRSGRTRAIPAERALRAARAQLR